MNKVCASLGRQHDHEASFDLFDPAGTIMAVVDNHNTVIILERGEKVDASTAHWQVGLLSWPIESPLLSA